MRDVASSIRAYIWHCCIPVLCFHNCIIINGGSMRYNSQEYWQVEILKHANNSRRCWLCVELLAIMAHSNKPHREMYKGAGEGARRVSNMMTQWSFRGAYPERLKSIEFRPSIVIHSRDGRKIKLSKLRTWK